MDIFMLIAAFGGGVMGAAMGAVGSFVVVGALAVIGGSIGLAGGADAIVGNLAFGSYIGPHVAFAGGVAAAAFGANKKKSHASGMDIGKPLHSVNDPSVLIAGGCFGIIGFLLLHIYANVLAIPTDNVALTVFTSAVIARFAFGTGGLFGSYTPPKGKPSAPRQWFPEGNALMNCIVLGLGVGIMVSGVGLHLIQIGVPLDLVQGFFPPITFGIAALTLVFALMGHGIPATHHIALPAALAAVLSQNLIVGIVFGIICSVFGDVAGKAWNSHSNTFIDPPATVIFTTTFIILAIWG